MGIVMPTVGVDPGPGYATTVDTALFVTVDQHNHTAGKGVQVPTAGININADLAFGGFSALGVNIITANGTVSLGLGLANSITLAGAATGTNPTITVAGDATRSLLVQVPTASGAVIAGLGVSPTTGGSAFLGSLGSGAFAALWLGQTS